MNFVCVGIVWFSSIEAAFGILALTFALGLDVGGLLGSTLWRP